MKKKTIIISLVIALALVSGGYGIWTENLNVKGDITVVPDPDVLAGMKSDLEDLESELESAEADLDYALEQQRLEEERLLAELQAQLEAEKIAEEQRLAEEQKNREEQNDEQEEIGRASCRERV